MAVKFEADGAAAGRRHEVAPAEQRHVAGVERHRRRVQRRAGENRRPAERQESEGST